MKLKFGRRSQVFALFMLAMLLLASCAPVIQLTDADTVGKTAMTLIYDGVFNTVKSTWGLTGWIAGIALGIALAIAASRMGGGGAGIIAGIVVVLFSLMVFHFIGASAAKSAATHALVVGSDTAKTRKANQYVEKLHIQATLPVREWRDCVENDYGSGCRYEWTYTYNYHEVCTSKSVPDSDGEGSHTETECHTEHDTRHVPYFTRELRTYSYFAMPDEYLLNKVGENSGTGLTQSAYPNMPTRLYTDWQAPEDYNNYLWGPSNRDAWESYQLGAFDYVIPQEFKAIEAALFSGRPYVITVWHSYVNWVFITADSNNLVTTSSQVEKYQSSDLLPQVNMIYSRFGTANAALQQDYDFIQFKGGLQPADYYGWQDAASMYSLNVGPTLQGSMMIWFVPAQSVDDPDAWIQAAKASLSDQPKWGFYMAPKNLILIGCGVDTGTNTISFCRMETGMPSGNVEIAQAINRISGVPFSPQGVFGSMAPIAVPDANGFYTSTMDVPADGMLSALFAPEPQGFKRVKMGSLDWLKTDIKLEAADINWVLETETKGARSASMWVSIIALVVACFISYGALQS